MLSVMMRNKLILCAECIWQYFQQVSNEKALIYFSIYSDRRLTVSVKLNCFVAVVLEVNSV